MYSFPAPKVFLSNINKIVLNILFEYMLKFFINEFKDSKNSLTFQYHIQTLGGLPEISDNTMDCSTLF